MKLWVPRLFKLMKPRVNNCKTWTQLIASIEAETEAAFATASDLDLLASTGDILNAELQIPTAAM